MKKLLFAITILAVSLLMPSFVGAKKRPPVKSLGEKEIIVKCFRSVSIKGNSLVKFKSYVSLRGELMTGPSRVDRVFKVDTLGYKILSAPVKFDGKKNNLVIGNKWNPKKFYVSDDNLEYGGNWKYSSVNFAIPRGSKAQVKLNFDLPKIPDVLTCTKKFKV